MDGTMLPNAFIGKPEEPTDTEVTAALGPSRKTWDQLVSRLADDCRLVTQEWNSSGRKYGWALRLKVKDRNIVYLSPRNGSFVVTFVLGDRAVKAALEGKLPAKLIRMVEEGKKYPEGTAVRIEPVAAKDIPGIVKLAAIKMKN